MKFGKLSDIAPTCASVSGIATTAMHKNNIAGYSHLFVLTNFVMNKTDTLTTNKDSIKKNSSRYSLSNNAINSFSNPNNDKHKKRLILNSLIAKA